MKRLLALMKRLLALLLLFGMTPLASAPVAAQSAPGGSGDGAEALFHEAAQHFIGKEIAQARTEVKEGLRLDPSNRKLRQLKKELDKKRKQQQSKNNRQKKKQNKKKGRKKKRQGRKKSKRDQQGAKKDQKKKQGRQPGRRKRRKQQKKKDPASAQKKTAPGRPGKRPPEQRPEKRGKMTRRQAERILRAMKGQEKQLLRRAQRRQKSPKQVEKDW